MVIQNSAISAPKFICEKCNINCSKKNDWDRHILTNKHIGNTNGNLTGNKKSAESIFPCKLCSKIYKSRKGLWGHSKTCNSSNDNIEYTNDSSEESKSENNNKDIMTLLIKESSEMKNIVLEIVKSNSELQKQNNEIQKQMFEMCKTNTTTNTINSHNNNKTFNLQFFLNEQCKDAMNISDFANSFDLQLSDLESVGELGYVEGITKIFVDKLNSMDIYKRPIHCSDAKREIIYIKDDNKWEREERSNPKLRYAIKTISFRNMKLANLWSDTYPESKDGDSYMNDTYMKLIKESTGGNGEISINEDKIIRRIAKEILIDKK
jgi:hypothetical protein